jgi:hypothetical protein
MLRDPVARAFSHYHMTAEPTTNPTHRARRQVRTGRPRRPALLPCAHAGAGFARPLARRRHGI